VDGLKAGEALAGTARDDRLAGNGGQDTLTGGSGNDLLSGGTARDVLNGGDGRDRLEGGTSADRLTGGRGGDAFVFRSAGEGGDRITDFDAAEGDRLVLFRDGFGGAASVQSGATVNTAHGGLFFHTASGELSYNGDGSGVGERVLVARLTGVSVLGVQDVIFL
jgi:Ca2+-binding RTX toxin-like protein